MAVNAAALPLIRTKLQRPRLPDDLVPRRARIHFSGAPLQVPVGDGWLGRVCNGRGVPIDGGPLFDFRDLPVHEPYVTAVEATGANASVIFVPAFAAPDAIMVVYADAMEAAAAGATCVIQPGGSMRDDEVIAAADAAGIAMVFTGMRHFRH